MDVNTNSGEAKYRLGIETDSRAQAGRVLSAAGLTDVRYVKADKVEDWQKLIFLGGVGVLAAGGIMGLLARDRVLGEWVVTAFKCAMIAGGAAGVGAMVTAAYDALHRRWLEDQRAQIDLASERVELESERVDLERHRMESKIVILRADSEGRKGVSFDGEVYRDLDSKASFTQSLNLAISPVLEQMHAMIELQRAMARQLPPTTYHVENIRGDQVLPEGQEVLEQEPVDPWRDVTKIPLRGLLDGMPSFRRLVLGVTVNEAGQREIVTADMADLVHVAVGGSSGWGKSVFLRSIAYQLAESSDPCELAMIDLEGATLAPFATCGRLLWPVADNERDAAAILRDLTGELDRRKGLFARFPGVDSLYSYNAKANGDALAPIVAIIDEATALLENKDIEGQLRTLALRARKYGLWCILAGQDWTATSLDTAIRNQLSTRVQFKAMSNPQSRVLLQRAGAEKLDVQGRALAWIPGRDLIQLQAPWLRHEDITAALSAGSGPRFDMPVCVGSEIEGEVTPSEPKSGRPDLDTLDDPSLPDPDRVRLLHAAGASDSAIAGRVWHSNPYYLAKVRDILAEQVVVVAPAGEQEPGDQGDGEGSEAECDNNNMAGDVDFCDFCNRDGDSLPDGVLFTTCPSCGAAICSDCLADSGGVCPDCADGAS